MANRRRGEVEAVVDGVPVTLCLTLGALCELEAAFEVDDLASLSARFASGRLSARDLTRIFACGLTGGGRPTSEAEAATLRVEGGVAAVIATVARLLEATFGEVDAGVPGDSAGDGNRHGEGAGEPSAHPPPPGAGRASPSPGTR